MGSRMKKIFHRHKDDGPNEPVQRHDGPSERSQDATLRTSLYDSALPGGRPETGAYPIKADGSSTVMQDSRSTVRGQGHYNGRADLPNAVSTYNLHDGLNSGLPPHPTSVHGNNFSNSGSYETTRPRGPGDGGLTSSDSPLQNEFSGMSLGDDNALGAFQTQPRQSHQAPLVSGGSPPIGYDWNRSVAPGRSGHEGRAQHSYSPGHHATNSSTRERRYAPSDRLEEDTDLTRRTSIPRKQVASPSRITDSANNSPPQQYAYSGHDRQPSIDKPLSFAPAVNYNSHEAVRNDGTSQATGILNRSRPISRGVGTIRGPEDIVERAKINTKDTEVIESIAPAVVHETVRKEVHNVRQEVITREIHNHDVYHRILPVIDVEVLPTRHFLPVEGGGLVEISAAEVPGRGNKWVVAETASKIPSDQPAPIRPSRFTAREFQETEGDAKKYMTPEGFERTEETWVHPPELETGGRDTGQTWPMKFGDAALGHGAHAGPSSKLPKMKGARKSSTNHELPGQ